MQWSSVSYPGDDACASMRAAICVSIASECAKIITRNCGPREYRERQRGSERESERELRLQGMPTYNRGAPSLPAICFIYPITRHYGRIVNAAVPVTIGYL